MHRKPNQRVLKIVLAEIDKLGTKVKALIDIAQPFFEQELDYIASNLYRYDEAEQSSFIRRRVISRFHQNYLTRPLEDSQ